MIQLKIAFLDEEEAYLEQLKGYIVRRQEIFFQIETFQTEKSFLAMRGKIKFDAVVMTEYFWDKLSGYDLEAKKILLCEGERKELREECLSVSKYQSAQKLLCQISAMLWREGDCGEERFPDHAAAMIGVYSPVHHEDQMLFSMTMAQILGEEQSVLYVSLLEHSGFYQLTKESAEEDVGDLIYGMMQGNHDFTAGLHRMRQSYRNFDYLPPVVNPEHLSEISKGMYEQLLLNLKNRSGYDMVVVDFGRIFLGFAEMIPMFGSFYCLGKEGVTNRFQTEEFFGYLEKEGGHTTQHMNRLLLPEQSCVGVSSPMEGSLYGGLGDYIRKCLYGGAEIGR